MGNKMKEIRIEKGLTLEYIAYKSKVSAGYLSLLENGNRKNPSKRVMENIAKALEEPVTEVFF